MKPFERFVLVLICAIAIVAIAYASESFEMITNHPWWLLGIIAVIAFIFRKPAYKKMDPGADFSSKNNNDES